MLPEPETYKISTCIPEEFLQELMDAVNDAVEPLYPGYDRAFCYWPVKGTWRPLEGSNPYKGTVGEIELADEMKLEFAVRKKDLKKVIDTIVSIHPYEEPVIDVIPIYTHKDIISWESPRGSCRTSSASCGS